MNRMTKCLWALALCASAGCASKLDESLAETEARLSTAGQPASAGANPGRLCGPDAPRITSVREERSATSRAASMSVTASQIRPDARAARMPSPMLAPAASYATSAAAST